MPQLLNKADLADPVATQAWLDHFAKQPGVKAVALFRQQKQIERVLRDELPLHY